MKHKRKIKISSIIASIIMIISVTFFCYSSYKIITWYLDNQKNDKIQKKLENYISIKNNNYKIDFQKLKKQNDDMQAWLIVNNTNINYAVVKGENNNYYLNHNFNKEYNRAGWVFMDYRNNIDDKNIIIYGHNTKDGSMFGSLKNILKKEWYTNSKNQEITLITEEKKYTYQVFAVYQIKTEDYYLQTNFDNNEFSDFINTITKRSIYNFNVEINKENQILTLSTCSETGKERVVLHAKKIDN